jgi:hypothetical protein
MNNNGHYMLNASGKPVYFIDFKINPALYCITFTLPVVEIPTGGSNPNSLVTGHTMQIVIPNSNITKIFGTNAGTYPVSPSTTFYNFNGQTEPIVSPVTSVNVCTNCSSNLWNKYSDVIGTFTAKEPYGSYLFIEKTFPKFFRCYDGSYNEITVSFYDQDHHPLQLVDRSQITATLLFRQKN